MSTAAKNKCLSYTSLSSSEVLRRLQIRPSLLDVSFFCPHAAVLNSLLTDEQNFLLGSQAAIEGTYAHDLLRRCLELKIEDPYSLLDKRFSCVIDEGTLFERTHLYRVSERMCEGVATCVEWVYDLTHEYAIDNMVLETRVGMKLCGTYVSGTPDIILKNDRMIIVIDFKFGRVPVYLFSERGLQKQTMFYSLAELASGDRTREVHIGICQPNCDEKAPCELLGPFSGSSVYDEWKHAFECAVSRIKCSIEKPNYNVCDLECTKCNAIAYCYAIQQEVEMFFDNINHLDKMPLRIKTDLFKKIGAIKKFAEQFEQRCLDEALSGETEFPGLEIKESFRNVRVIKNEKSFITEYEPIYGDLLFTERRLKSPAQLEKEGLRKAVEKNCATFPGKKKYKLVIPTGKNSAVSQFKEDTMPNLLKGL